MRELCIITIFNIKKMLKTWPIWIFSCLILISIGGGLFYLGTKQKVDFVQNNEDSITNDYRLNTNYTVESSISSVETIDNRTSSIQKEQSQKQSVGHSEVSEAKKIENTKEDNATSSEILSFIALFLTYGFTLLCGSTITNSVASEKISKVSDLIVYRVNPVNLVYGKILALFTIIGMIICAVMIEIWGLMRFNSSIKKSIMDLEKIVNISWQNVALILVICACAIIVYTLLYAVVGMFVHDQQQLQFAQLPVTVVLIITFVSTYFAILHPNTFISKVGVFIPFISPFMFMDKVLNGFTQIELWGFVITEIMFLILCNFVITRIFIPKKYY